MGKREARPAPRDPEPIEAELRLTGEPEVLKAVFASPCLALGPGTKEKVSDLDSRYFDTSDQDLHAQGLAFRVRANGAEYRQTLKTGDDAKAALLKRGEWDMAIEDDQPRPDALPEEACNRLPKAVWDDGLRQAFATRVHRRAREVVITGAGREDSRIEVALDLGEIETGAGSLPVAEIELELLEGSPEAVYSLALALLEIGPLHLETRSKSARAFDRLSGNPPDWHSATALPLSSADRVDDAMAAIFASCFAHWMANQAAAIDGRDPEGVHQVRVALRRLRSALGTFRKLISQDQLDWLQAGTKAAISALGPARDWDVFQIDLLLPVIEARPQDPDLTDLRRRARAFGKAGYRRARAHLESAAYTRFVLQFGQWLEGRAWRENGDADRASRQAQPITDFARQVLNRRHQRTLAKGRKFKNLSVGQRHELRLAVKKMRYAVEFFRPLFPRKTVNPFLHSIKALQTDLGHLNDVAVAEALMADLLSRPAKHDVRKAAGMVTGWHAYAVAAVEPELRGDWQSFKAERAFWR